MEKIEMPKVFWKYYDLFRRNQLSLVEFSQKTGIAQNEILQFLKEMAKN